MTDASPQVTLKGKNGEEVILEGKPTRKQREAKARQDEKEQLAALYANVPALIQAVTNLAKAMAAQQKGMDEFETRLKKSEVLYNILEDHCTSLEERMDKAEKGREERHQKLNDLGERMEDAEKTYDKTVEVSQKAHALFEDYVTSANLVFNTRFNELQEELDIQRTRHDRVLAHFEVQDTKRDARQVMVDTRFHALEHLYDGLKAKVSGMEHLDLLVKKELEALSQ